MNNSLKHRNTFGIDVKCKEFKEYHSLDELLALCSTLSHPYIHIGQGSNLLFTKDYDGVVLHCAIKGIRQIHTDEVENENEVLIEVGGGEIWDDVVAWCVAHGFYGVENLSLIPGEMGAAAVQNIGAYGAEIGNNIAWVDYVHIPTNKCRRIRNDECRYAYRSSIFKTQLKGQCAIYSVTLRLSTIFTPCLHYGAISECMKDKNITAETVRKAIIDIRNSKLPDPKSLGNAGSYFMNPIVSKKVFDKLIKEFPNMPHYFMGDDVGIKIPAGWLIEQCGWKGRTFGKAGVYAKQALVLVNLGGATGNDILNLQHAIQHDVKETFGVDISPEVNAI